MALSTSDVFTCAIGMAWIASLPLAAQQSAPQSAPAEMTITGCLKSGPNPSGIPDPVTYTLEPIETAPAPPSPAAGAADAAKPKTPTRYTLASSPSIPLSAHVGHRVEVTGHLKDLSNPETRVDREPGTKPPMPGGAHNTFEVATLKMVSPKCP
jgi:hypothetical protein